MAGNIGAYILLALAIRQLKLDFSYPEILAIRSAGGIAIGLILAMRDRRLFAEVRQSRLALHLGRSLLHAAGSIAVVWSIANLPLGLVASIDFCGPVFATAIGFFIFRSVPTLHRWLGIGLIACGASLVIFHYRLSIGVALVIPFAAVLALTCTNFMLATLSERQSTRSILLIMNMVQFVVFMALSLIDLNWLHLTAASLTTTTALPHGPIALVLAMLAIAGSGYMTQVSLSHATRHGTAVQVSALDTLRIPALAISGALLFGEHLELSVVGPGLIIMSGAILIATARSQTTGR